MCNRKGVKRLEDDNILCEKKSGGGVAAARGSWGYENQSHLGVALASVAGAGNGQRRQVRQTARPRSVPAARGAAATPETARPCHLIAQSYRVSSKTLADQFSLKLGHRILRQRH
jgi:hypothetical protein